MLPDLSSLPPELMQQIQQIEQQAQQQITQAQQQAQAQVTVEQVAGLLKDQKIRPFVLDIETDSTIQPDENAEKQKRIEYLGTVGQTLQQILGAMQVAGASAPAVGKFSAEALRYASSAFRPGRQMDDAIDELAEAFANYEPPPPPQGEDPQAAQMTAQAEMAKAQAAQTAAEAGAQKAQADAGLAQQEMQLRQQEAGLSAQETASKIKLTEAQTQKVLAEIGKVRLDGKIAQEEHQVDTALAVQGEERAVEQQEHSTQMAEREFERSAKTQAAADKRASAESAAKVQSMKQKDSK